MAKVMESRPWINSQFLDGRLPDSVAEIRVPQRRTPRSPKDQRIARFGTVLHATAEGFRYEAGTSRTRRPSGRAATYLVVSRSLLRVS